jgi:hypothetical protein
MAGTVNAEASVGDPLHLPVGRVLFNPLRITAKSVAVVQHWRVLSGLVGKRIEFVARDFAQFLQMWPDR